MAAAATMTRPTEQEGTPPARLWRALHHHGPDEPATQRVDVEWWYDLDEAARVLARHEDQGTRKFGQKTALRRIKEAAAQGDRGGPRKKDDPVLIDEWKTRLIAADASGTRPVLPVRVDKPVYYTLDQAATALARARPRTQGRFGLRTIQRLLHQAAQQGDDGTSRTSSSGVPSATFDWYRRALVEYGVFDDPGDLAPADEAD